jgi:phage terminase large subunit-like protein
VLDGRIVAGPHVRNACRRHLADLAHGHERGLTYDLAAARHVWSFFEGVLKLSEGQFEGIPFNLHPVQAFKLGSMFGWKRADGTRRFRRAYIEEGKGNGKSPFVGGIGLYLLTADGEPGAEIYAAGAKKEQAGILFRDAVKMYRKSPALKKRLKPSGGVGREYNLAALATGSFFRPISKDAGKTGSGPRPHGGLCDEVHEHPNRDVMEMLERGFKFRRQPLLVMITNSGSDRNSVCWEEHQHAVRVAAGTMTPDAAFAYVGEVIDDTTFSFVCALDPGDDPLTDRSCWLKANPLLGTILTEDYLAGVTAQARQIPGKLNGILRLHFCVWTDSDQAWISREALESCLADFDPEILHAGKEVSAGADLSGTTDLSALGFWVETGTVTRFREDGAPIELPTYDAWIEAWTPGDTLAARALKDQAPYDVWVRDGHLHAPPGKQVRFDSMVAHLAGMQPTFLIRLLAFDRYAFARFLEVMDEAGLTIPVVEHPQGGKRRAKAPDDLVEQAKREGREPPLGLWMPGSLNFLEELILDGRIRLRRNPVLVSACMSAAIEADAFDNRWFSKRHATQRIDPLVALAMGGGAAAMTAPGPLLTGADALMVI